MIKQTILVLDFGGQYKELIARCIRNLNVHSYVKNGSKITANEVKEINPMGIILTGGPNSVYEDMSPKCDPEIFKLNIPVLGICYGMHLLCHSMGGIVSQAMVSEYGKTAMSVTKNSKLFKDIREEPNVLMSHTDTVAELPQGFYNTAKTLNCQNAACEDGKNLYCIQFHPETDLTDDGKLILKNFLYSICGCNGDYDIGNYLKEQIEDVKKRIGKEKILLALSGGVDSSVCAALLSKAVPGQLTCIFVDHGFMRLNEGDEIEAAFSNRDLNFIRINAEDRFLSKLKGICDPEQKRKIIGREFIEVFEEEALKLGNIKYLAQGTIYPDIIESGGEHTAVIKSHHNVGGLPETLKFKELIEPLKGLFKDEVRKLGKLLELPKELVERQPFPGPGLAVRVMGEVVKEKLDILRRADFIFREEVDEMENRPQQYFAIFTGVRSVGVKGDFRTYDNVIALRAVMTNDFMTCDYAQIPHNILEKASSRIVNEVKEISRVVYDITSKPPATVEWE